MYYSVMNKKVRENNKEMKSFSYIVAIDLKMLFTEFVGWWLEKWYEWECSLGSYKRDRASYL